MSSIRPPTTHKEGKEQESQQAESAAHNSIDEVTGLPNDPIHLGPIEKEKQVRTSDNYIYDVETLTHYIQSKLFDTLFNPCIGSQQPYSEADKRIILNAVAAYAKNPEKITIHLSNRIEISEEQRTYATAEALDKNETLKLIKTLGVTIIAPADPLERAELMWLFEQENRQAASRPFSVISSAISLIDPAIFAFRSALLAVRRAWRSNFDSHHTEEQKFEDGRPSQSGLFSNTGANLENLSLFQPYITNGLLTREEVQGLSLEERVLLGTSDPNNPNDLEDRIAQYRQLHAQRNDENNPTHRH